MTKNAKYDIFISYRRSSFESANMIANALKAKGYRVFFDVENLRSGKFNEQLFDVIGRCTDFLLILPQNALDRCNDPEDWVRKEILCAMKNKKNIVPVMLSGFSWPVQMPSGLEDLQLYQSLTASSREYFDLAMARLSKAYLKSRPHRDKFIRVFLLISLAVVALSCITYRILRITSVPMANRIGNEMLGHIVQLDDIAAQYSNVHSLWDAFSSETSSKGSMDKILQQTKEMLMALQAAEEFISESSPEDTVRRFFGVFHSIALTSRGLRPLDLAIEPEYVHQLILECLNDIQELRRIIEEPDFSSMSQEMATLRYDINKHLLYAFQYSNAEVFADMPRESRENFLFACRDLKFLPRDIPLTLSRDEYISKQQMEMDKVEKFINDMQTVTEKGKTVSDEMLEKEAAVNVLFSAVHDVIVAEQESAAVIASKKEKIEAMRTANKARIAELEEMDKEMVSAYNDLVAKCTIEETDDKWYKWGKVCKFASFIETMATSRKALKAKGITSTSSITPEVLYANISSMLNTFKTYHPESEQLAESAKIFYYEVS